MTSISGKQGKTSEEWLMKQAIGKKTSRIWEWKSVEPDK